MAGLGLLILLAVALPMLDAGGFEPGSQALLIVLAGVALFAAALIDGPTAVREARRSLGLSLIALSLLSVFSAAWTIGMASTAIRSGLVIGAYAALGTACATLSSRIGPGPIAAAIALLALVEAVLGLRAVAWHDLPDAERIVRAWRPGGSFEYPPAVALLQVGALPVLSRGLCWRPAAASPGRHCEVAINTGSAIAAILAGAVLRLADSRLAIAMAVVLIVASSVPIRRSRQASPGGVILAALVGLGALLGPLTLGGDVPSGAAGRGMVGLAELVGSAAVAAGAWRLASAVRSARWGVGVAIAAIALAAGVSELSRGGATPPHALVRSQDRHAAVTDLAHGRTGEWRAAWDTWLDRPVLGAGAGTYAAASRRHQRVATSLYAHDLPLELAAELGALGLALGLLLYATAARALVRAWTTPTLWLLGPFVAAFLISNLFDWTWHLAGLSAAWAAAAGAMGSARA